MLFSRWEGVPVRDVPLTRRLQQFVSPTRLEAQAFFDLELAVAPAEALVARLRGEWERPPTLFQVLVAAVVRTLGAHPRLNRFVINKRVYQRRGIWLTLSVKQTFHEDAPVRVVKREFTGRESLAEVSAVFAAAAAEGKGIARTATEREARGLLWLPRPLLSLVMGLQRWLDAWNLLPAAYYRHDVMYASVFLTNLGSVGLESCFHHLWNYGTCPFFANLGLIKEVPVVVDGALTVRRTASLKVTMDERIEDGFYCARALATAKRLFEQPEELLTSAP